MTDHFRRKKLFLSIPMLKQARNCYHSANGIQLTAEPLCFTLDLTGTNRFSVCVDLECGARITHNRALVQVEFSDPPPGLEAFGLVHSHHGWWYRYIPTLPGRVSLDWEFAQADSFEGSVQLRVCAWNDDDTVMLKSFAAVASPQAQTLIDRYAPARDAERYPPTIWHSISEFLAAPTVPNGAHIIPVNDLLIEFIVLDRRSPTLFCFLHGNAPRSDVFKLPIFSGTNMMAGVNSSVLIFSDPALLLDPDLQLAWHAGTSTTPLQYLYELITRKVKAALDPQRLVFWGGSGGGFASLYMSSRFSGSTAFVWNPQTSIYAFDPPAVKNFGNVCFDCDDLEELPKRIEGFAVADLSDVYPCGDNHVIYLQNFTDWHTDWHLRPFLQTTGIPEPAGSAHWGWLNDRFFLHLGNLAHGHTPPPKEALNAFLLSLAHKGPLEVENVELPAIA
jgi:hypothetical protein